MAQRPAVGVTGNGKTWSPSWWCIRIALWICGGRAVRISMRHSPGDQQLDALVISGGDDIAPEHYGGDINARVKLDPERDELEIRWIKQARQEAIPILGICRGAQLINAVFGGNLHQDIRAMRKHTHNRPGLLATKRVDIEKGSKLAQLTKKQRIKVNSLHHQAIDRPGKDLVIVAHDRDRIVQAIECSVEQKIIGVQWHPEYLFYLPSHLALFRWLVAHAD